MGPANNNKKTRSISQIKLAFLGPPTTKNRVPPPRAQKAPAQGGRERAALASCGPRHRSWGRWRWARPGCRRSWTKTGGGGREVKTQWKWPVVMASFVSSRRSPTWAARHYFCFSGVSRRCFGWLKGASRRCCKLRGFLLKDTHPFFELPTDNISLILRSWVGLPKLITDLLQDEQSTRGHWISPNQKLTNWLVGSLKR